MSCKAKLDNVTVATFFLHSRILMNGLKYSKDEIDFRINVKFSK